jgi:hypothetical protein
MSYLIDSADHVQPPFLLFDCTKVDGDFYTGPNDLRLVQRDIASYLSKKYIPVDVEDNRFSFSLSKLQGCAAFSIKAVFFRPSESRSKRFVQRLFVFALPIAHLFDFHINMVQFVIQTIRWIDAFAVECCKLIISQFLPKTIAPQFDSSSEFDTIRFHGASLCLLDSYGLFFADTLCLPFYLLGFVEPIGGLQNTSGLQHSYWVYDQNTKKHHLVLDQGKIKWLQKKYGYPEDCKVLENVSIPYNPALMSDCPGLKVSQLKISYDATQFTSPEDVRVTATWTNWKFAYTVGNVNYYKPIYNTAKTHNK